MTKITKRTLIFPALALLLLAAAFIGYQAVSAQNSQGPIGGDPPSAPTGLAAEPVDGLVHLSWDALGDDSVTDVHISRTVDGEETGGHWIHISNADYDVTTYIDHHLLEPATTYVYTVGAQNEFGQGSHSEPATVTTDPPKVLVPLSDADAPSAPLNVTAEAVFEDGRHKIRIAWDEHASDEGVTGWQITRRDPATSADRGYVRYGGHGERSDEITITTLAPVDWMAPQPTPVGQ